MNLRLVDEAAEDAAQLGLELLDRRAVTEAGMRKYLSGRGFAQAAVDDAITAFAVRGWLNDRDYAAELIRQRAGKAGLSRTKLASDMEKRGLGAEQVRAALESLEDDNPDWEYQNATAFVQSKYASTIKRLNLSDREEVMRLRQKIWRGLVSRGFGASLCVAVLQKEIDWRGTEGEDDID